MSKKKEQELIREAEIKAQLYERAGGRCEDCGGRGDWRGLAAHHAVFRSHGGSDTLDNLVLLCGKCHSKRHGIKEVALG